MSAVRQTWVICLPGSGVTASPVRYVLIIQSNIESGPKMLQFNIHFKIYFEIFIQSKNSFKSKSKIFNSIFNSRIWWKIIQNAQWSRICFICPKLELLLALLCLFSTLYALFSHFHLFFILCRTFYQT